MNNEEFRAVNERELILTMAGWVASILGNLGIYLILLWVFVWLFNVHFLLGLGVAVFFVAVLVTRFKQNYAKGLTRIK